VEATHDGCILERSFRVSCSCWQGVEGKLVEEEGVGWDVGNGARFPWSTIEMFGHVLNNCSGEPLLSQWKVVSGKDEHCGSGEEGVGM